MKLGTCKSNITPQKSVPLAGFGRPDRNSAGVYDDLYMSTFALENNGKNVIIICCDLLGIAPDLVDKYKRIINDKFGFEEQDVLFSCSHTHSGPQLTSNMLYLIGTLDEDYEKLFERKVVESVRTAISSKEEVETYIGKSTANIGINRRRITNGVYDFAPFEDGVNDKDVIAVKFVSGDKIKGLLFNHTCHASTIDTDYISADWPGRAKKWLHKSIGDDVVIGFMQGCCGNIRTRTIKDNNFCEGKVEDIENFGKQVADSVVEILNNPMIKIEPEISTKLMHIQLPLNGVPSKDYLEDKLKNGYEYEKAWAKIQIQNYDSLKSSVPYSIHKIDLSNDFCIVALNGEVCVEYSLYVKELLKDRITLVSAYSDGTLAYIPTDIMLDQGGYEPVDSTYWYKLPSPFGKGVEGTLKSALKQLIQG